MNACPPHQGHSSLSQPGWCSPPGAVLQSPQSHGASRHSSPNIASIDESVPSRSQPHGTRLPGGVGGAGVAGGHLLPARLAGRGAPRHE